MEWNTHLTAIQGTLISIEKVVGPLIKIRYKGGNEEQITKVVQAIEQYLNTKEFVKAKVSNPVYGEELQGITLFMFLNTGFDSKSVLDIKEFSHLRNVTPPLSRCLLANVIIELDLTLYYSRIIQGLPIEPHLELLQELITCIKQSQPENAIEHTYVLINEIIVEMCTLKEQEILDKLSDITSEMLRNVTGFNVEFLPERKLKQIHQHMGITLMYLLRLLRKCPVHASNLSKLIDNLIRVAITLMKSVTINVFCVWAEVSYEEQPLQMVLAGEAYLVIQHLQKFKPALELVLMLGSIAKKPKTLEEIVNEADVATMIAKVNKCDNEQRQWFKAFINNNPFQNQDTLDCLKQWSHLCNKDDLTIILNGSLSCKDPSVKKIVLECANNLNLQDLIAVSARYIFEKNSTNLDTGTISDKLKILLNKLEVNATKSDDYFIKQVHLMLLENSKQVMICLFDKCKGNVGIIPCLESVLKSIKDVAQIHSVAKIALLEILNKDPPAFENIFSYIMLLNMLLNLSYFTEFTVICDILMPLTERATHTDPTTLLNALQVVNTVNLQYKLHDNVIPFIGLLLNIMETHRCPLLTFSSISQQIVHQCVCILLKYRANTNMGEVNRLACKEFLQSLMVINKLNQFYIENMEKPLEINLLGYVYPTYNINNLAGLLEMVLPSCVEQEWIYIIDELEIKFGHETTYSLLTNILIILCQLSDSHKGDNSEQIQNGLRYCLEIYGIVIKDVFRRRHVNLDDEIFLTKNICRLLSAIPQNIRQTEGLGLIQLLSTESLQALKNDKTFIFLLVSIKDATVSQMLAKRMIS